MIQFRGVVDKNIDQFRQPGKQVVLYPAAVQDRRADRAVRQGAQVAPVQTANPGDGAAPRRRLFLTREADLFSFELLLDAIVLGLLLGCFYAAVSLGLSVAFGLLDVPHIAHPAFLVLGSYGTYVLARNGWDPILAGIALMPLFFLLGIAVYRFYYETFEKRGTEAGVRGLAFFFGVAFIIEVGLMPLVRRGPAPGRGRLHRQEHRDRRHAAAAAPAGRVRRGARADHRPHAVPVEDVHRPRHQGGGAGRAGAAADGREPGAHQAMGVRHRHRR